MSTKRRSKLKDWSTRDLLVVGVLGIVFGLIGAPLQAVWAMLEMTLGPVGSRVVVGIFWAGPLMAAYIVRRPGTAFLAALLFCLVQVPLSAHGWGALGMIASIGIPTELTFTVTRYRHYGLASMMIRGALSALVGLVFHAIGFGYANLSPWILIGSAIVQLATGAILGGWLAKALADAVAKAGVLSGYAVGQAQQQDV
jgi:energy-coupling factor transport system substrate-specific component